MKFRILLALLCLSRATAAPITIPDFSFETGDPTGPGFSYTMTPWARAGYGGFDTFKEQIAGFVSDGVDHLGIQPDSRNSRYVYQDLTITYQANTT